VTTPSSLQSPSQIRPPSELASGSSVYPFRQLAYAALARRHGGGGSESASVTDLARQRREAAMVRLAGRLRQAEASRVEGYGTTN
jgi:hypothetical protein